MLRTKRRGVNGGLKGVCAWGIAGSSPFSKKRRVSGPIRLKAKLLIWVPEKNQCLSQESMGLRCR